MTGAELRRAREARGESLVAFAARLGIAEKSLRRYEAGSAPVPLTVALALAALAHGLKPWAEGHIEHSALDNENATDAVAAWRASVERLAELGEAVARTAGQPPETVAEELERLAASIRSRGAI